MILKGRLLSGGKYRNVVKKVLPFMVFFSFAAGAFFMKNHLERKDDNLSQVYSQGIAQQISFRLKDSIDDRLKALEIMARRWGMIEDRSYLRFQQYAETIISTFPGIQAIALLNDHGDLKWKYSKNKEESTGDLLTKKDNITLKSAFLKAKENQKISVSTVISINKTYLALAVYYPLTNPPGKTLEYLAALIHLNPLFESCFTPSNESKHLHYCIYEHGRKIFSSFSEEELKAYHKIARSSCAPFSNEFSIQDQKWRLSVYPPLSFTTGRSRLIIHFYFFAGLLISAALSLLVFFLIKRGDQNKIARIIAERAEQFSSNIISIIPSALIVVDKKFTIKSVNDSFYRICELEKRNIIGQKLPDLLRSLGAEQALNDNTCPFCSHVKLLFETGAPSFNVIVNLSCNRHKQVWIKYSVVAVSDLHNDEALIVFDNITEQYELHDALQRRNEYIEALFRYAPDAIVTLDHQHRIVEWNNGAVRLFGYEKQEVKGKNVDDLIARGDKLEEARFITKTLLEGGIFSPKETVRYHRDGHPIDVLLTGSPLFHEGELVGVMAIYTDISDLKRTVDALEKSEERYRNFVSLSSEAIWRFDLAQPMPIDLPFLEQLEWGYKYAFLAECNEAMAKMYGLNNKNEILGAKLDVLLPKEDERSKDFLEALFLHHYNISNLESYEPDVKGNIRVFQNNIVGIVLDNKLVHLWGTQRDITKQKMAEQALKASEDLYRTTIDAFADAFHVIDRNLTVTLVNKRFREWLTELNINRDVEGQQVRKAFHFLPESVEKEYQQVFDSGKALVTEENTVINGESFITETHKIPVIEAGKAVRIITVLRDITAKKKAEDKLKLLAHTISSINEAVTITNLEGKLVFVNNGFLRMYGCKAEDVLGTKLESIITNDQTPPPQEIHRRTVECGFEGELINRKADGTRFPIHLSTSLIRDDRGDVIGLVGIARDISIEKDADIKIKESEAKYRSLVETSPDAIYYFDKDAKLVMANRKGLEMLKVDSQDKIRGRSSLTFVIPEDVHRVENDLNELFRSGAVNRKEYTAIRSDGSLFPCELNASLIKDKDNLVQGFILDVRDITERKDAELTKEILHNIANSINNTEDLDELLDAIRQEVGKLVNTTNFFIALYDEQNDVITLPYFQDIKDKITSFPAGKTLTAYVIKNNRSMLIDEVKAQEMIAQGEIQQHGTMCKVWLGVPLRVGKKVIGAVVIQDYDYTDALTEKHLEIVEFVSGQIASAILRKQAEEALHISEERYRTVVESSHNGIAILDDKSHIIFVNDECQKIFGYSKEELLGADIRSLLDSESAELVMDRYQRRQRGEIVPAKYEFDIIRKDGEKRRVELISKVIKDHLGKPQTIAQLMDITEKKRAESALLASEELNRGIVTNAPVGILYLDRLGRVIYENPAMTQVTGRAESRDEMLVGRSIYKISEIQSDISNEIDRLLAGYPISGVEFDYRTRSGNLRKLEMHGSPRKGLEGEFIGGVIMVFDLTEYKSLEAHLRHAQKMEAIGTLAGGIAHDFNNLLTGIMGNVELALLMLSENDPIREKLKQMQRSAERAAELTAQLLAFGRQRMEKPKPANLNSAIDEAVAFIKHTIDKRIEIDTRKDANLWVVRADLGQMNQVLLNLIYNAADSMPKGGKIVIKTGNVVVDEKYCSIHADAKIGDFVKIEIQDSGCGIPPEALERIFEPFFTTKPVGKGSGLGLSMVYGIIKGHEGWIQAYSEVGKGTNFKIYLPRVKEGLEATVTAEPEELKGGVETVLLVDDEELVRSMGNTMLNRFGYKVILAEDGVQAVEIYRREKDNIGLVILDVTMPKKSGRETLIELLNFNPEVKVIISSGFDRSGPIEELLDMGARGFVQKPYKIGEMLRAVRAVLDEKRRREKNK